MGLELRFGNREKRVKRPTVALVAAAAALGLAAASDQRLASPQLAPHAGASVGGLIEAVRNKDVQSVRALLKQGVDVNAADTDGRTALDGARTLRFDSVITLLTDHAKGR